MRSQAARAFELGAEGCMYVRMSCMYVCNVCLPALPALPAMPALPCLPRLPCLPCCHACTYVISVVVPRGEPLQRGWYACKLDVDPILDKVKEVQVMIALDMVNCESERPESERPSSSSAVAIQSMRWLRGTEIADRTALCWGENANSYRIRQPSTSAASSATPAPSAAPATVKQELPTPKEYAAAIRREARRKQKPPYAVTDDVTAPIAL